MRSTNVGRLGFPSKGGMAMSIYEILSLLIALATLIYIIITDKQK